MSRFLFLVFIFLVIIYEAYAQPVPAEVENIPFLMTFGTKADKSWGDDDFSQTFFFQIPENYKGPVYIRVFDPDVSGGLDEMNGVFDTQMFYSVYGGKGAYSDPDARETDPKGNYKCGTLLASKKFGAEPKYDNNWYTFGPFNPTEGEHINEFGGCYIFKIICDGITGDDGNMYRYYLSSSATENKPIEGANAFAYEYSFRMWDNPKEVSHIYPYVDEKTISVRLSNFDWDNDGFIRVVSVARQGQIFTVSDQDQWKQAEFTIKPEERNTSLDFQFIKRQNPPVKNNNVVVNVRNQYGELLRFYTAPIGGVPRYKYGFTGKSKEE
jgi:hypothetical protein